MGDAATAAHMREVPNFGKIQKRDAYGQGSRKKSHMGLEWWERALGGARGPLKVKNW